MGVACSTPSRNHGFSCKRHRRRSWGAGYVHHSLAGNVGSGKLNLPHLYPSPLIPSIAGDAFLLFDNRYTAHYAYTYGATTNARERDEGSADRGDA